MAAQVDSDVRVPLVRLSQALPFTSWMESRGIPTERLLRSVGLPTDPDEAPDLLVAERPLWRFLDRAARVEGIEDFGWRAGEESSVEEIGTFGHAIRAAASLRAALETFFRELKQHSSHGDYGLTVDGEQAWFWRQGTFGSQAGREQAEQYVLMLMIQIIRLAAGPRWTPSHVLVEASELVSSASDSLAGAHVECGAPVTAIRLPREMLSVELRDPLARRDPHLSDPSDRGTSFLGTLRQAVDASLPVLVPGIDWAAEVVGTSPRTLQRRLQSHSLTWSGLVDQARKDAAFRLLVDPGIRISDIAQATGYSNPANFNHAFRRWTGSTPCAYREQRLGSSG
ncbi:MAG: AraC family transcriptional regulator ligand-binding domain-containing protein [Deltaproteobacteria bacterium]|nr:AraC family transcriptional regulator ligand-binding domain-containing protein [Deltaproteobacteria bacterium]MBW2390012.1 AraC family transcriptional regulator ligand-binding domain-containing protein [Deltaproteobacteria bacterium]MBW2726425.1 AraC family transcriptional regulator ligand-binding domain-containing protein [Deltaproteobacteria bacterium]